MTSEAFVANDNTSTNVDANHEEGNTDAAHEVSPRCLKGNGAGCISPLDSYVQLAPPKFLR